MTNKHIGHDGKPYDSVAEAKASFRFAELGCIPAKGTFDQTFSDADGTPFHAKPDFYHSLTGLYIEFKCATLNGVKTKANSEKQLADKEAFKGNLTMFDRLKFGWNHARRKHAIVQRALTPRNYIVVFDKPPAWQDAFDYYKAGIVFCPMSALPSYLAKVRLAQRGVNVSFQLSYEAETKEAVALLLT